jgi:hypothetical protein
MQMETSGRPVALLLVMMVFLSAWLGWLFLAQVPVYAVGDTAVLTSSTQATAQFTPDSLASLQSGQTGLLRLEGFSEAIPATVVEVDQTLVDGRFTAQLQLQPPPDLPLQAGLNGRVEIEVEQVSPFTLLLRTTKQ